MSEGLFIQISTSVLLTLMAVTRSVPTPLDHFSADATVDLHYLAMEDLVWMSMSVQQALTTASKAVPTL